MNIKNSAILLLMPLLLSVANAQQFAFHEEDEVLAGWYHSFDMATWLAKGGDRAVIEEVLQNIENSSGAKRHPELVDTQIEFAPGNWAYEWVQAGDAAMAEADQLNGEDRLQKLRAALTYYSSGSWPHLGRVDDRRAHAKSVEAYLAAGAMLSVPVQHVELSVGSNSVRAYFHLPAGEGPFPVVINSFGSDVTKEDSFDLFVRELEPRGIGMLAVDMPGIGEANHLSMQDGSDVIIEAGTVFLRQNAQVDADNLFVVGGSFGGNAAARAFYRLDVAGVVSMCGPLHSPFLAPPEVLDALPLLTIDGVKSRFGLLDQPTAMLSEVVTGTSLVEQGFMNASREIDTPLYVITTNRDPVAPLDDLQLLLQSASDNDVIVLDIEGHCPPRQAREPMLARWVEDHIR